MTNKAKQTKFSEFKVALPRSDSGRVKTGVAYLSSKTGAFIASEPLATKMRTRNNKAREILKNR